MTGLRAIEVLDLQVRYGGVDGFHAVRGTSFHVNRGEIFGLLGTNGAGKTTTLDVLEGLNNDFSGEVRVLGLDPVMDRRQLRPYMGTMLQEGGFPSDLRCDETLKMLSRMVSAPLPVNEVLAMVDLTHRADVHTRSLSGGERRRLDLACAVLGQPDVLFLDEPTTGLDPESRRNAWRLIESFREGGLTIVLTTHYLEEAEFLADRLAIMHRGEIVRTGAVDEIVAEEPSVIEFLLRTDVVALPNLLGDVVVHGDSVKVSTHDIQYDLTVLMAWGEAHGIDLGAITAHSASLESIFLDLSVSRSAERSATSEES